jgi:hypothetical protein
VLVSRLIKDKEPIVEIVLDSPALAASIRKFLSPTHQHTRIHVELSTGERIQYWLKPVWNVIASFYHTVSQLICSKLFRPEKNTDPDSPLTLIDTFIYSNSFSPEFGDRHFPRLFNYLSGEELRSVFYLPTFYKVKNYVKLFRALRKCHSNFLIKEDYLGIEDYLFAFYKAYKARYFKITSVDFMGLEISPIVNRAYDEGFMGSSSIEALLKYRLAEQLKNHGVLLRLVVDWFENQEIDHGANMGFRTFFPDIPVIGYQGFIVPKHYLCMFPTELEFLHKVIPDEIAVLGRKLIEPAKEFCSSLKVDTAPAFRFQNLWAKRNYEPDLQLFSILISLPIMPNESHEILELMSEIVMELQHTQLGYKKCNFRVKPHPATSPQAVMKQLMAVGFNSAEIVSGNFSDWVEKANIVVSNSTSSCMEALSKGVPVIIIGSRRGLTQNPIPENISRILWNICLDREELIKAIQSYMADYCSRHQEYEALGASICSDYFTQVTPDSIRKFLKLQH